MQFNEFPSKGPTNRPQLDFYDSEAETAYVLQLPEDERRWLMEKMEAFQKERKANKPQYKDPGISLNPNLFTDNPESPPPQPEIPGEFFTPVDIKLVLDSPDGRQGHITIEGRRYNATLADLPTTSELFKPNHDESILWKHTNVNKILVVHPLGTVCPNLEPPGKYEPNLTQRKGLRALPGESDFYQYAHGLTPSTQFHRRKMHYPMVSRLEMHLMEKEVCKQLNKTIDVDVFQDDSQYIPADLVYKKRQELKDEIKEKFGDKYTISDMDVPEVQAIAKRIFINGLEVKSHLLKEYPHYVDFKGFSDEEDGGRKKRKGHLGKLEAMADAYHAKVDKKISMMDLLPEEIRQDIELGRDRGYFEDPSILKRDKERTGDSYGELRTPKTPSTGTRSSAPTTRSRGGVLTAKEAMALAEEPKKRKRRTSAEKQRDDEINRLNKEKLLESRIANSEERREARKEKMRQRNIELKKKKEEEEKKKKKEAPKQKPKTRKRSVAPSSSDSEDSNGGIKTRKGRRNVPAPKEDVETSDDDFEETDSDNMNGPSNAARTTRHSTKPPKLSINLNTTLSADTYQENAYYDDDDEEYTEPGSHGNSSPGSPCSVASHLSGPMSPIVAPIPPYSYNEPMMPQLNTQDLTPQNTRIKLNPYAPPPKKMQSAAPHPTFEFGSTGPRHEPSEPSTLPRRHVAPVSKQQVPPGSRPARLKLGTPMKLNLKF